MNKNKREQILKNALTLDESRGSISRKREIYMQDRLKELELLESIREYRKQSNLSQEGLAKKAKVSRSIIAKIETGAVKSTTLDTIYKIGNALNMDLQFVPRENSLVN